MSGRCARGTRLVLEVALHRLHCSPHVLPQLLLLRVEAGPAALWAARDSARRAPRGLERGADAIIPLGKQLRVLDPSFRKALLPPAIVVRKPELDDGVGDGLVGEGMDGPEEELLGEYALPRTGFQRPWREKVRMLSIVVVEVIESDGHFIDNNLAGFLTFGCGHAPLRIKG